jgi:K+-transporting ATPase ATPase C chain
MNIALQARTAILMLLIMTVLTGVAYPLLMTGLAQVAFPYQANGSLIRDDSGAVVGSELIGQSFTEARYFHSRPSAAGYGYDSALSSGSNLGPTSESLIEAVEERAVEYRQVNGLPADALVPVDAVTASGSGLDPHISPANALLQTPRVARARNLPETEVRALVDRSIEGRTFGILGEPRVSVLKLNLALDSLPPR